MRLRRKRSDPDQVAVVGGVRTPFTDLYHRLLGAPWFHRIVPTAPTPTFPYPRTP